MNSGRKGVTFISSIALFTTLIVFHNILDFIDLRCLLMSIAYVFIALALDTHKGIINFIERIWNINQNGEADIEKFVLIKSFIALNVNKWDRYWQLYQEIVNGKKVSTFKRYLLKIPKGTISLKQFIWILGYITFNVLRHNEIIPFISGLDYSIYAILSKYPIPALAKYLQV